MTDTEFRLGPPETKGKPYYRCEADAVGFTGPLTTNPVCPSCGRTGEDVVRMAQTWVDRRFDEEDALREVVERSRAEGVTNEDVIAQRRHEVRLRFGGSSIMATKEATKEKAAKAPREKKIKEKKPCRCGCDTLTGGNWAPGHDARFGSAVRKVASGNMTQAELAKAFPADTIKEFQASFAAHK